MKQRDLPPDVLQEINRRAEETWEDNYEMKNWDAEREVEACEKIQSLQPDGVPSDVLSRLKKSAATLTHRALYCRREPKWLL